MSSVMRRLRTLAAREKLLLAALGVNLAIFLAAYGVWIFNRHFSTDSLAVLKGSMTYNALNDGRVVSYLFHSLMERLPNPLHRHVTLGQAALTASLSACSALVFRGFANKSDKKPLTLGLLYAASVMLFVNMSVCEADYDFPEVTLLRSLDVWAVTGGILLFMRGYDRQRLLRYAVPGFALLCAAMLSYQVYVCLYVILCCAYVLFRSEGRADRRSVGGVAVAVGCGALGCAVCLLAMRAMISMGLSTGQRGSVTLRTALDNARWLLGMQKYIWADFISYLTPLSMRAFAAMALGALALCCCRRGMRAQDAAFVLIVAAGCYVCVYVPQMGSSSTWCSPRVMHGLFVWGAGLLAAGAASAGRWQRWVKRFAAAMACVVLATNVICIQQMGAASVSVSRLDEQAAWAIVHTIERSEAASGEPVTVIAVGQDASPARFYPDVSYSMMDTNVRALALPWGDVNSINYYTGRNFGRRDMTAEEQAARFGRDVDMTWFDPSSQVVVEGGTAYLLVH